MWKATLLSSQTDSGILKNKNASGLVSPVRSSKRSASTVDQDSTEKATKLKVKNLESSINKGNIQQPLPLFHVMILPFLIQQKP